MKLFSILISVLVPVLFVETCLGQPDRWNAKQKDRYLEEFKKCAGSAPSPNCHMGTVIDVVISYQKGDLHVLDTLMDAAGNDADYIAETLGWFFSELLCEKPRTFLAAVAARPEKEHARLLYLAAIGDSQNQGCLAINSLRQTLEKIANGNSNKLSVLAAESLVAVNKYSRSSPKTGDCLVRNYRFKSDVELAKMSPRQLVEEEVQREFRSPSNGHKSAQYSYRIRNYLAKNAASILPITVEYMNAWEPRSNSECDETRFYVAMQIADGLDDRTVRLRGIKEGRLAIDALARAVARMHEANTPSRNSPRDMAIHRLEMQQGTNISDEFVRSTLKVRHAIVMTDDEYIKFVEFLVSFDPTYPSWSVSAAYQVPMILKDSRRYFEAYKRFRAKGEVKETVRKTRAFPPYRHDPASVRS